jgi:hypothetical protein
LFSDALGEVWIILKWILEKWDGGGGTDWIALALDSDKWQALVKTVMNLQVIKCGEFFV